MIFRISSPWAFAARRCPPSARWRGCPLPAARRTARRAEIKVDGGAVQRPAPAGFLAAGQHGTRVEVRELFYATPARLKFLKSARSEDLAITDIVKRLAMARPDIGFTLTLDGRRALDLPVEPDLMDGRLPRLARIMGRDFGDNAVRVEAVREGVALSGYAGLPTYNRANAAMQFLFVNGRPVRDKLLVGAVRGAYADFLARDRHPALALFLDCDPAFRGCECPSRQDGSALPRCRAGARADRGRAETCAGRSRAIALPPPWRARRWRRSSARRRESSMRRSDHCAPRHRASGAPAVRQAVPQSPCPCRRGWKSRRRCRTVVVDNAAGRGAGAVARNLYRRPDRATASSSSTSMPRMSGWSMSG